VITYGSDASALRSDDLAPFFDGWPTPPSPDRRLAALRGADHVVLAYEGDRLVGFATALTDGALTAHVALLEVVPDRRRRGIGTGLVRALEARLGVLYGVDLCCDEEVVPFYEGLGFSRVAGMVRRDGGTLP
jgi:GNAT superfamily N-acetyltransferase